MGLILVFYLLVCLNKEKWENAMDFVFFYFLTVDHYSHEIHSSFFQGIKDSLIKMKCSIAHNDALPLVFSIGPSYDS